MYGAAHAFKIGQGLSHPHEDDVVDFLAACGFNCDELLEDFTRLQVARKTLQPTRAKLAAVGAPDLSRNANRPAVRPMTIKRR